MDGEHLKKQKADTSKIVETAEADDGVRTKRQRVTLSPNSDK